MARFAYVRKFCIYAKFAYVCKSGHVYRALVYLFRGIEAYSKCHGLEQINVFNVFRGSSKSIANV